MTLHTDSSTSSARSIQLSADESSTGDGSNIEVLSGMALDLDSMGGSVIVAANSGGHDGVVQIESGSGISGAGGDARLLARDGSGGGSGGSVSIEGGSSDLFGGVVEVAAGAGSVGGGEKAERTT